MNRELEVWDRTRRLCPCTQGDHRVFYSGVVREGGTQVALWLAFLYDHAGMREVFTEVTLGSFDDGPPPRVTFAARTGPRSRDGSGPQVSTFVDSTSPATNDLVGHRLTAAEAREHRWAPAFWRINDEILTVVPEIAAHRRGEATLGERSLQEPSHDFTVALPD